MEASHSTQSAVAFNDREKEAASDKRLEKIICRGQCSFRLMDWIDGREKCPGSDVRWLGLSSTFREEAGGFNLFIK